ncbi:MAG: beta-ketoacyl-ACP synthase II [Chloroflexi bacterium]|nr:beta-ketoacyl-ACP synthase II [Dehalococcoidia bacterium]MCO5203235.1 beta-ketoacyl-ACP synthase II [Chloroflexota bacterium]PWB45433.1 MAG: beta-ketoacyl-[acyl-carrier-protein] synthase II [Dehalococcoidia bacterium]
MTRAVVTGVGAITPIGLTAHEFWENLVAGVSGAGLTTRFDTTDLPVKIAAEVKDFEPGKYMDAKGARRMSRFAQFAVAAAQLAADDAGLVLKDDERRRAASAIATGGGGVIETIDEVAVLQERGPGRVSPFYVPTMAPNMGACQVSMHLGLRGPALASVAACASGLYSYIEAKQLIDSGRADVVLAGGTEAALHRLPIAALANMKALSRRNDEPERASRPFDRDRDGFVFGEGAAVMVIESEARAKARGARVYAELMGGGLSCDAYHITAPLEDGSGAQDAMAEALVAAGMQPEDMDYIAAHGTGTPLNDVSETRAIKLAFGDHARKLAISSPKSMVGHLLGGAGAVGALAAALAVYHDTVPPTINLETADPECDLDYTPLKARKMTVRAAAANGFGFGGQNGSVIFRKYLA